MATREGRTETNFVATNRNALRGFIASILSGGSDRAGEKDVPTNVDDVTDRVWERLERTGGPNVLEGLQTLEKLILREAASGNF